MDIEKNKKLALIKLGYLVGKLCPDLVGSVQFNFFKGGLTTIKVASTISPKDTVVVGASNDNGKS